MFAPHLNPHLKGNVNTTGSLKEEEKECQRKTELQEERVLSHIPSETTGRGDIRKWIGHCQQVQTHTQPK